MNQGYMKEDIGYSIILLSRVMGLLVVAHLSTFMVNFIETIRAEKIPLHQATTLSEKLCEQLRIVKDKKKFYMTSYMVYLLTERAKNYLGLLMRGSMQDHNDWPYIVYPQLVKKYSKWSKEYRIVNDVFIFFIIQFIKGDYGKRLSD